MEVSEHILPLASQGKKLILFGAGDYGHRLAEILREQDEDFAYYIDNCSRGGYVCGKPVYAPQQLSQEDKHQIFVFLAADKAAWDMAQQLTEMGLISGAQFMDAGPMIQKYRPDPVPVPTKEYPYEDVHIGGLYAPWNVKEDFADAYRMVKDNTLVDIHRLWNLWSLVAEASKVDGMALEIGVWRGGSGCMIAKRWSLLGRHEPVCLCDTFTGVVKVSEKDNYYKGHEHADTSKEIVSELVRKMELTNVRILQGIFPEDTGAEIPDQPIAFAHIDVDVYESCRDVVRFLWPRLSHGGILVFDDYGFPTTEGVRLLLDDLKQRKDLIFIAGGYGLGILIKK